MRAVFRMLAGVLAFGGAVSSMAGESAGELKGKLVTVNVVLAEVANAAVDLTSGAAAAKSLHELVERGAAIVMTRVTLTSRDGQPCRVQIGEETALTTGRMVLGRHRGEGCGSPFQATSNYGNTGNEPNTGTLISLTPQVQEDGSVVVDIEATTSRIDSAFVAAEAKSTDVQPPRVSASTMQTTIHIPPGETVIVGGSKTTSPAGSSQSVILVSARVSEVRRGDRAEARVRPPAGLRSAQVGAKRRR